MRFLKSAVLSPRQIESRRRIRAKGRKHYIVYRGILRWGFPCFITTTVWGWHDEYGWRLPPRGYALFSVISGLIIWSIIGYFYGDHMWQRFYQEPETDEDRTKSLPD